MSAEQAGIAEPSATGSGRRRAAAPDSVSIEQILEAARQGVERVDASALPALLEAGTCVIDIRAESSREATGYIPGAIVMDRLVLEWRLDPASEQRMENGPSREDLVIIVCDEGFYSSLAARDLRDLGFRRATDVVGGFAAYAQAGLPVAEQPSRIVV